MILIKLLIIFLILTILINMFPIRSINKVKINLLFSIVVFYNYSSNLDTLLVNLLLYLCFLYVILNIYTTRYSSIRMNLMNSIIFKKKLITEKDLYKDRERRFKRNNKTIMSPILFNILDKLVRIFKNVFI